jgi:hypothetical protein
VADSSKRRHRGRSRKRRPPAGASRPAPSEQGAAASAAPERERVARGPAAEAPAAGERPRPPWYPLPLSELLILVGAIGAVVGLRRGSHGGPVLLAGLAAVMIGTIEVTLREHLAGYRSHALILALLPTIIFHSTVALGVAAFTRVPGWLNVVLVVLDVALFTFLLKLLRARYLDARRERPFAGRR